MLSSEEFLFKLKNYLTEGNVTQLLKLFNEKDNADTIRENPWEIIPCVTEHMNDNLNIIECCEELLEIIGKISQPDDILLILIKDVELTTDEVKVLSLLKPLQSAILNLLPKKRINYLAWSFNSIQTFIYKLPTPKNLNLEGREKLLMDFDDATVRITKVYSDLLPFYNPIMEEIEKLQLMNYKILTEKYLVQLLGKPFAYLDMDCTKPKSKTRIIAESLMFKIEELSSDVYQLLTEDYCISDDIRIKKLAVSVFFYLFLSERIGLDKAPKLYDPVYVFQNCLKFVVVLFKYDNQFVVEKGLKLAGALLEIISEKQLSYELLDSKVHCKFCKSIANILIYSPVEVYRKTCLEILHTYIYCFNNRGRYLLMYNMIQNIKHVSLVAYIITQYKEMMVEQLDKEPSISEFFHGAKLATLLRIFCSLPDNVETDLIKSSDQIIASINLLRYLMIRDKENQTKVWDHVEMLKVNFLEPLKKGLILSRAHYDLKLKEVMTEKAHGDKSEGANLSVTIGGENLPELSSTEKLHVLNSSITAFDVMESLLGRLNECIEIRCNAL